MSSSPILEAIRAQLLASPYFAMIAGERAWPGARPQGTALPAATFRIISRPRWKTMVRNPGVSEPRITISAIGRNYTEARALADAITLELDEWPRGRPSSTLGGLVECLWISLDNELDRPNYAAETPAEIDLDFVFKIREPQRWTTT